MARSVKSEAKHRRHASSEASPSRHSDRSPAPRQSSRPANPPPWRCFARQRSTMLSARRASYRRRANFRLQIGRQQRASIASRISLASLKSADIARYRDLQVLLDQSLSRPVSAGNASKPSAVIANPSGTGTPSGVKLATHLAQRGSSCHPPAERLRSDFVESLDEWSRTAALAVSGILRLRLRPYLYLYLRLSGFRSVRSMSWPNRDLEDAIPPRAEEVVSLDDLVQREAVREQRCWIEAL